MKSSSLLILIPLAILASCGAPDKKATNRPQQKIVFHGKAQGTFYNVTYYGADTVVTQKAMDSLLSAFDLCASMYNPKSIISRINRNEPVEADSSFKAIFNLAMDVSEKSGGAFDITVGPLVNAWGFGFKQKIKLSKAKVDSLRQYVGYKNVHLEGNKVVKSNPGIILDFNAIAQGYSVDLLAHFLERKGITDYLIEIGGEVIGKGKKADGKSWVVGVEKPSSDMYQNQEVKTTIKLENMAVSTSGSTRKYYEENGIRYSHTIDPATGYPVKHSLLSVSVLAPTCAVADAYATVFMVLGLEKSKEFLKKNKQLNAYFIYSDKDTKLKTYATEGFQKVILEEN
ncbi:MAG: FAD:protein FMN transferase [Bacteroidota bacterium]